MKLQDHSGKITIAAAIVGFLFLWSLMDMAGRVSFTSSVCCLACTFVGVIVPAGLVFYVLFLFMKQLWLTMYPPTPTKTK